MGHAKGYISDTHRMFPVQHCAKYSTSNSATHPFSLCLVYWILSDLPPRHLRTPPCMSAFLSQLTKCCPVSLPRDSTPSPGTQLYSCFSLFINLQHKICSSFLVVSWFWWETVCQPYPWVPGKYRAEFPLESSPWLREHSPIISYHSFFTLYFFHSTQPLPITPLPGQVPLSLPMLNLLITLYTNFFLIP